MIKIRNKYRMFYKKIKINKIMTDLLGHKLKTLGEILKIIRSSKTKEYLKIMM